MPVAAKNLKYRRVPWTNREEWISIYEKMTGGPDYEAYVSAVAHMETWINREKCPPAVEYTCRFLQPMVTDSFFFPSTPSSESESNLRTQYATSILRFINILGEVDSVKSLSLNARALKLGLPDWVVNIRHQISHGSSMPSLDVLRVSVKSLLTWLTENYWSVEKEAMEDVVLVDNDSLVEEKFGSLLRIYVYLSKQRGNVDVSLVRDIKDEAVKAEIKEINRNMYHTFKMESTPWDAHSLPGLTLMIEMKKLQKLPVSKLLFTVIHAIKIYFDHDTNIVMKVFIRTILQEDECNESGLSIWEPFIISLHRKGKLLAVVDALFAEMHQEESSTQKLAETWILFLLNSLWKRSKVEKKLRNLSSTSEPTSKRMKLTLNEKQRVLLTKERIKLQLADAGAKKSKQDKFVVLDGLFEVVERQNPSLKKHFRLQEPKFFSESDLRRLLLLSFASPFFSLPIAETLVKLSEELNATHLQRMLTLFNMKHDSKKGKFVNNIPTLDTVILNKCLRA